jgi:hypothetical protein
MLKLTMARGAYPQELRDLWLARMEVMDVFEHDNDPFIGSNIYNDFMIVKM